MFIPNGGIGLVLLHVSWELWGLGIPWRGLSLGIDLEKLDLALDRVLDAAVDSALWSVFLEEIAEATGSYAASIVPFDRLSPSTTLVTRNITAASEEYYQAGWPSSDWNLHARNLLTRDGIARTQQFTPPEFLDKHDFFRFMGKHALRYSCLIEWHAVQNEMLCLGLHRTPDQQPYSDEEAAILLGIRERLMVAARMAYRVSQNRISGTIGGLDIARIAAIFFDPMGKVTYVNKAALPLMDRDLRVVEHELRSFEEAETAQIRRAISSVLKHDGEASSEHVEGVAIERKDRPSLYLRIQRLAGEIDLFAHSAGLCIIEVPEHQRTAQPDSLRKAFGLTEQEALIAVRLCEGLSLREISEATERSYETVRTHMKSILQKTGTSRQGELIALVAKMKMFESNAA